MDVRSKQLNEEKKKLEEKEKILIKNFEDLIELQHLLYEKDEEIKERRNALIELNERHLQVLKMKDEQIKQLAEELNKLKKIEEEIKKYRVKIIIRTRSNPNVFKNKKNDKNAQKDKKNDYVSFSIINEREKIKFLFDGQENMNFIHVEEMLYLNSHN